jgi:hypothetical protein
MSEEVKVNLSNQDEVDFKVNLSAVNEPVAEAESESTETVEENQEPVADSTEQVQESAEPQVEETQEEVKEEVSREELVNQLLSDRFNITLEKLPEVLNNTESQAESVELTEDIKQYLEFKKETKRGLADFVKLQEDIDARGEDELLREYYAQTKPGLESSDVDYLLNKKYGYDAESASEDEIKSKQLEKKEELYKAKEYFNKLKEKYKTPLESSDVSVPEDYKEAYSFYSQYKENQTRQEESQKLQRQAFEEKTRKLFNDDFEGFEFKVGEKNLKYKPKSVEDVIKTNSDLNNFIKKHLDDNGNLKDAKAYHTALTMAMNPESFAAFFYEQGKADAVNDVVAGGKNVDMGLRKSVDSQKGGTKFRVIDDSNGTGLKIKK